MSDDERHSELEAAPERRQLSDLEAARQATQNGFRLFDALVDLIRAGITDYAQGKFKLRPSTLMSLDRVAVDGMVSGPGSYRQGPTKIGHSNHIPPPHEEVPRHVEEMCEYLNEHWGRPALHLAAYVIWRLCWIHPFEDGNGRTARAAGYVVLCVRLRAPLPGRTTVMELIAGNKQPYYSALEAADHAYLQDQSIDVAVMETLLSDLLLKQVLGAATDGETRQSAAISTRALHSPRAPASTLAKSPAKGEGHSKLWWTVFGLILAAVITALGTILATADGQHLMGCGGSQQHGR